MAKYSLNVDVTLADENAQAADFEQGVREFLAQGAFGTGKLVGQLFLKVISRTPASPSPHYVNLWMVPSLANLDLATVMNKSRDDVVYKKINALVAVEIQEFIALDEQIDTKRAQARAGNPGAPASTAPGAEPRFVRAVHQFKNSGDYGKYAVDIIGFSISVENSGWECLGIFWSVTGQLNTFTEFWQVPASADETLASVLDAAKRGNALPSALDAYAALPNTSRILLSEYPSGPPPEPTPGAVK